MWRGYLCSRQHDRIWDTWVLAAVGCGANSHFHCSQVWSIVLQWFWMLVQIVHKLAYYMEIYIYIYYMEICEFILERWYIYTCIASSGLWYQDRLSAANVPNMWTLATSSLSTVMKGTIQFDCTFLLGEGFCKHVMQCQVSATSRRSYVVRRGAFIHSMLHISVSAGSPYQDAVLCFFSVQVVYSQTVWPDSCVGERRGSRAGFAWCTFITQRTICEYVGAADFARGRFGCHRRYWVEIITSRSNKLKIICCCSACSIKVRNNCTASAISICTKLMTTTTFLCSDCLSSLFTPLDVLTINSVTCYRNEHLQCSCVLIGARRASIFVCGLDQLLAQAITGLYYWIQQC